MKDHFAKYLSEDRWKIYERGWDPEIQNVRETQFALGNGYVGSRGVLEEIPAGAYPGTYIAGVYDQTGAQVTELINAPNPVDLRIVARGEKLSVVAMDVLEHSRILDMQKGLLWRRTIYSNSKKKRFDYQSLRFFSMDDPHIGAIQIYLTPLDGAINLTIQTAVDCSVTNKGVLTEGKKRHFQITEVSSSKEISYLCTRTLEKGVLIAYASCLRVHNGKRSYRTSNRTVRLRLKKGQTVRLTKIFSIYTSFDIGSDRVKGPTIKSLRKSAKLGFDRLLDEHTKRWADIWKNANVEIKGDPDVERALRFNVYHLLIAGYPNDGRVSIGARSLSGEGYRGHIFWDTEIFILPFFIYTNPSVARNLLLYRYNRLDEARSIASHNGFKGAQFPWESADTGQETTPTWYKDFDGSIIRIHTMEMEHHITCDVAYAASHYYLATRDEDFLLRYGLEMIFEAARFWASRVEYNKRKKIYEIKCVIGPDEFHEEVNNNAFTNAMARWNLLRANELYRYSKVAHPKELNRLAKHIRLEAPEVKEWGYIARRIKLPYSKKRGLIEAFDGYFKKREVTITNFDDNFMPIFPKGLPVGKVGKTRLVKQADVVMLLYLLPDLFSLSQKKRDYFYYERRTLHKSSLSPSMHTIVGLEVGDEERAYRYFIHSLDADLRNVHGNTSDGIHAASLGGTWQAVVNGFAGMRIRKGVLTFNPKLPPHWKELRFMIKWKGLDCSVAVFRKKIELRFSSPRKSDRLKVRVYGTLKELRANKLSSFYKRRG